MAVAYESIGSAVLSTTTSLALPAPSGLGTVLLAHVHVEATSAPQPAAPTGWNAIGTGQSHWSNSGRFCSYWRAADGGSNDSPSFSLGTAPISWRGIIKRLTGADASNPVDTYTYFADDTAPTTHPSVTSAAADSLWEVAGGSVATETGTASATNSVTMRYASNTGRAFYSGDKQVGAGATGSSDVTYSTTLIRVGGISLIIKPAASGSTFNDSVAETAAATDTVSSTATMATSIAESSASAETASVSWTGLATVSETSTIVDSQNSIYVTSSTVAETSSASDSSVGSQLIQGSIAEVITVSNSQSAAAQFLALVSELAVSADSITKQASLASAVTESSSVSESQSAIAVFSAAITDTATASTSQDGSIGTVTHNVSVIEAASAQDLQSCIAGMITTLSESVASADLLTAIMTIQASLAEMIGVSDSVSSGAAATSAAVLELSSVQDSVGGLPYYAVLVGESVAVASIAQVQLQGTASISEIIAVTDQLSAAFVIGAAASESAAASDLVRLLITGLGRIISTTKSKTAIGVTEKLVTTVNTRTHDEQ